METYLSTTSAALRLPVTEQQICAWLGYAAPGERLVYYRGHLVRDVAPGPTGLPEHDRGELLRIRRRALWAAEQGLALLVQKRHAADDYSYIMQARRRPQLPRQTLALMEAGNG